MADPAPAPPPKKPAGPMKYILLGCGVLTGLFILGMGGCAGVFYFIYKATDPIAKVGSNYLHEAPELKQSLGDGFVIRRNALGWNVQTANDRGNARIEYSLSSPSGAALGQAVVWLVKSAGQWEAVGARVSGEPGKGFEIGKPPREHHRIQWDD